MYFIDKELKNVDPRDKNLSTSMKLRIINECKSNISYFINNILDIHLNPVQKLILREKLYERI